MIKKDIILKVIELAKAELKKLEAAHSHVAAGVNSSESKQEGKYDTRALLDSYLAGGQEVRIKQLKFEIQIVERPLSKEHFSKIIKLQKQDQQNTRLYLLIPYLGGYKIELPEGTIQTLTPKTLLAKTLADKEVGDVFEEGALAGYFIEEIL